jgi:hypothetical protein
LPVGFALRIILYVLHAVTVRRVALRSHDRDTNRCDVLRGIGFAYRCSCGSEGRIRGARLLAVQDGRAHRLAEGESVR